jgi:hypothetical protein
MYADIAVAADAVAAVDDTDECIELLHTATSTTTSYIVTVVHK